MCSNLHVPFYHIQDSSLISLYVVKAHASEQQTKATAIMTIMIAGFSCPAASASGNSFCMRPVSLACTVKQLAVPQSYPSGQHPATGPASLPQRNQPLPHVDVGPGAGGASVARTTTVAPLETIVVAGAGQSCVSQFLPVRQQPPP